MPNVNGPVRVYNSLLTIRKQPGCLVQLLFFVFIGWWLGALAVGLAYFFFVIVIGIPLGVLIINKIPYLMALRETEPMISVYGVNTPQHNFFIRAIWFLLVGWWAALIWISLAYIVACTIIGMPIGFWMFDKAPGILTLRKR